MNKDKECILVVDDIQMTVEIAVKELKEKYEVITALSGEEGYELLKDQDDRIKLVLLDIYLPEMDGFEFLNKMKENGFGHIPVIIMTSDDEPQREIKALKEGAADFIKKPLYVEILQNRVENVLMRNQMEFDALTGLFNRSKTFKEIRNMLLRYPGKEFAFLRFDIDNFSIYNSSMGEEEGNKLLLTGARTLKEMPREKDSSVYGRIDADVFCVCELYDRELVEKRIQNTLNCLRQYRSDYRLEASFGVCVFQGDADVSVERIYTNASLAAHTCKGIFDKHYSFYEPWMSNQYIEEQNIINEMEWALEHDQFVPYLQPKYDLDSDEPCGAEALVRWMHPEKGMISPGKFIPIFEKNGFISKLDYFMWDKVCSILKKWKDSKMHVYPISVNVSRISLHNPNLVKVLLDLIRQYGLFPELLQLEITESAYMTNPTLMKETIKELQECGFTILMDDFGSGYSSLNTLKEINVDILKVDMKFLPDGDTAERSEKILSSVIRMAGWLGIPTIAEGVETVQQRNYLKGIGCDYIQGYYYARPMPVEEYEQLMGKSNPVMKKNHQMDYLSAAWSSDEKINEILTAIQLPVAIVEYSAGRTDVVRVNLYYGSTFGRSLKDYLSDTDQERLKHILQEASSEGVSEGEFTCIWMSGKKRYIKIKIKRIEQSPSASLLCAIMLDISAEKTYGIQLKKLNELVPTELRTKMLIVDDSALAREVTKTCFKEEYDFCEAENGQEALEILREESDNIAIIILDMFMPIMDGRTFLLEKKNVDNADMIPVIVMSSESDSDVQLDMLALGVNDYITKPFDKKIFKQKVQNAIMFSERFVKIRKEYEEMIEDIRI